MESIRCRVHTGSMFICHPAVAGAQCGAVGLLLVGRHSRRPVVTSFCLIIKKRMHGQRDVMTVNVRFHLAHWTNHLNIFCRMHPEFDTAFNIVFLTYRVLFSPTMRFLSPVA